MSRLAESPGAAVTIDVVVEAEAWTTHAGIENVVNRAATAAADAKAAGDAEVAVLLADDAAIRTMNQRWRGQDKPTNVLSFPASEGPRGAPRQLGDIVIAYETTAAEARDEGKPFDHHVMHLVVHGVLHLLGYDHESDDEAEAMERQERDILAGLGVPDPYAARDAED